MIILIELKKNRKHKTQTKKTEQNIQKISK